MAHDEHGMHNVAVVAAAIEGEKLNVKGKGLLEYEIGGPEITAYNNEVVKTKNGVKRIGKNSKQYKIVKDGIPAGVKAQNDKADMDI